MVTVAPAPGELGKRGWAGAQSVGMVYRVRQSHGKTSEELIYFISSLPPKVRVLAKHLQKMTVGYTKAMARKSRVYFVGSPCRC